MKNTNISPTEMNTGLRRPRSDSKLASLPPDQRAIVDHWLFTQNLGFREIVRRCREQFHLPLGTSSVKRYYHRCRRVGQIPRSAPATDHALTPAQTESLYQATLALFVSLILPIAEKAAQTGNLQLAQAALEAILTARREMNRSASADLARQKSEFNPAAACLLHLPAITAITNNPSLTEFQCIQKVRDLLFPK